MFPIIYTPTEGDAIQDYSRLFRRPEGCFLNIRDQGSIDRCLSNFASPDDVDYIVVSDGEEVRQSAGPKITNTDIILDPGYWRSRRRCHSYLSGQVNHHYSLCRYSSITPVASGAGLWDKCMYFWCRDETSANRVVIAESRASQRRPLSGFATAPCEWGAI